MGEGSSVAVSCGVGQKRGSDPVLLLLYLWCSLAAIVPIGPLAWELLYAMGAALKSKRKKKKKKNYMKLYEHRYSHPGAGSGAFFSQAISSNECV